jgi:hypothetical protein
MPHRQCRAAHLGTAVVFHFGLLLAFGGTARAQMNEAALSLTFGEGVAAGPALPMAARSPADVVNKQCEDPSGATVTNPWNCRPVCASMFLTSDFQLSGKQRACDWLHNGVFSTDGMLGAAWSAGYSMWTAKPSESGDGYWTRFGRKFGQNAFKASGAYLGGLIAGEDPRRRPPFLALRTTPPPRGFWKRFGHAVGGNFVSYRCSKDCSDSSHIGRRFALSRVLGSLASGFSSELLTTDRPYSSRHAWNGVASAYGSTFVSALFVEFQPELSAAGNKIFGHLLGGR